MTFFMLELTVANVARSRAWYQQHFGFTVEHDDAEHGFSLLSREGFRLSLHTGTPQPGGAKLFFQVADLADCLQQLADHGIVPAQPLKTSAEGYQLATVHDPDGYRLGVFEWLNGGSAASP